MRLLNTSTFKVEEFFDDAIPLYAILSHTWDVEEITLQDMLHGTPPHKKGYQKLVNSCAQARKNELKYIWIDTCCIDKSSSAELSEAINSMYRWYHESVCCYIYLSDVPDTTDPWVPSSNFRKSRWFTRGWTLQELIAPATRIFFSASWEAIGCAIRNRWKQLKYPQIRDIWRLTDLVKLLAEITGIEIGVLKGSSLSDVSVARRMSWAAKRKTTRMEDIAYCLMGIFDVNMPLLYGEGRKAFIRLQEEILQNSDDESLFAHSIPREQLLSSSRQFSSLLALSPASFSEWANVGIGRSMSKRLLAPSVPASMTSKGLRLQLPLCHNIGNKSGFDRDTVLALLDCKFGEDPLTRLSIPLARLPQSRDQYVRLRPISVCALSPADDGPTVAGLKLYLFGKPQHEVPSKSVHVHDIRMETIYVVSSDYAGIAEERTLLPYFRLKRIIQPPGRSLVLENVHPRQWWDDKVCILLNANNDKISYSGGVSGVVHFREKETGLGLDILLGTSPGEKNQSQLEQDSSDFLKPWCRISSVNQRASISPDDSDTRLELAFKAAKEQFESNALYRTSLPTTDWVGGLVAKVKFEVVEFLGREEIVVQVEIS